MSDKPVPGVVWWQGPVECDVCGYGKDGRARSVVPIPAGTTHPIIPLECGGCRNMTLHPKEPKNE